MQIVFHAIVNKLYAENKTMVLDQKLSSFQNFSPSNQNFVLKIAYSHHILFLHFIAIPLRLICFLVLQSDPCKMVAGRFATLPGLQGQIQMSLYHLTFWNSTILFLWNFCRINQFWEIARISLQSHSSVMANQLNFKLYKKITSSFAIKKAGLTLPTN